MNNKSIALADKEEVPLSRETRMKDIAKLPNKSREAMLPPVGFEFQLGPYVYRVAIRNIGQMRFTAVLHDVVVEGIND